MSWGQIVWEVGAQPGVIAAGLGWSLLFLGLWALAWVAANWGGR